MRSSVRYRGSVVPTYQVISIHVARPCGRFEWAPLPEGVFQIFVAERVARVRYRRILEGDRETVVRADDQDPGGGV